MMEKIWLLGALFLTALLGREFTIIDNAREQRENPLLGKERKIQLRRQIWDHGIYAIMILAAIAVLVFLYG
jgi:hypothetical protein